MKIAILGRFFYSLQHIQKAKRMGLSVVYLGYEAEDCCIAKECDRFEVVPFGDVEKALSICREEQVDGVFAHREVNSVIFAAEVAERLGLPCTPSVTLKNINDKAWVRKRTAQVAGLSVPRVWESDGVSVPDCTFPVIVKPATGKGKIGLSFVSTPNEFKAAFAEAKAGCEKILVEEYIEGVEFSVETLSAKGHHHVLQISGRTCAGAPHFVELGTYQPARFEPEVAARIHALLPKLLSAVGLTDGPAHSEFRLAKNGGIYLLEINPRGAGATISSHLVTLSTNVDYPKAMLEVALGTFVPPARIIRDVRCCGEVLLCQQTEYLREVALHAERYGWLFMRSGSSQALAAPWEEMTVSCGCAGYLVYLAKRPIDFARFVREPLWRRRLRSLAVPFFALRRKWWRKTLVGRSDRFSIVG